MSAIMNVRDTLSAKMAECYVTIENNRYNFMQAINLTAKVEKTKIQVPILGQDIYFDIQVVNEDPSSDVGRQSVILIDCNIDGGILAKFDAEGEYLDEEMEFTFEDFKIVEEFNKIDGM